MMLKELGLKADLRPRDVEGDPDGAQVSLDLLDWAWEALGRIYSCARSLERGETPPLDAAQDIQRMVFNGMNARETYHWPWKLTDELSLRVVKDDDDEGTA